MSETYPGYSAAQALRGGGPASVRDALVQIRGRTLAIADAYAAALAAQGLRIPYSESVNPPLWEWGHIAWFQEYWIGRNRQRGLGSACEPEHQRLAPLLPQADAFYDSSRVAHRTRWELPLPDAAGTRAYLSETFAQTLQSLERLPEDASDGDLYFFRLVALHEAMHAEAATYMARALAVPLIVPLPPRLAPDGGELAVRAQTWRLGSGSGGFAFDNELGPHDIQLEAFHIDAQPVSNAKFAAFVEDGGLRQRRWWSDEGWVWLQAHPPQPGERPLDPQATATHLSFHAAEAWCRWAGRRLPTEAEWECAALTAPGFTWGQTWEWTASVFRPYPGFTPHPYRDYSEPWFETRQVLRGACPATSPWLTHPRYRNFFEPGRNDIYSGFRSCA
jgi:gamma-glutamyl hercynylcysteine S-oxide synthase